MMPGDSFPAILCTMQVHPDRSPSVIGEPRAVLVTHYFPAKAGGVEIVAFELAKSMAENGSADISWFASATTPVPDFPLIRYHAVNAWNFLERRFGIPWPLW